jgi:hypothetical protein
MSTQINISKPIQLEVNTTPITSGTVGGVFFQGAGNVLQQSPNIIWYNSSQSLYIGASIQFGGNTDTIRASGQSGNWDFLCGQPIRFLRKIGEVEIMRIVPSTTNVLIGTATDAGFKLDVNGTARVQGNLTLGGEIFGATNTYFNGPTINTGTLWLRFAGVNSSNNFTATGTVQGNNILANSGNAEVKALGTSIPSLIVQNTTTSATWRIESHRTTSGALEFKNDINNPVLNLFSTRNVGIGTFTDAGFRLDVNGTARVQGNLTLTNGSLILSSYYTVGDGTYSLRRDYLSSYDPFRIYTIPNQVPLYLGSGVVNTCVVLNGVNDTQRGFGIADDGTPSLLNSAVLQLNSTKRGFLPPRMTTTQKNAISSPATGLMVYDTDLNRPCFYNGTSWITL